MPICKYCNEKYLNPIHVRWCFKNPLLLENKLKQSKASSIGVSERTKIEWIEGKYNNAKWNKIGRPHTEETKKKISKKALQSNHRRLVKSCRKYITKDGKEILLDSSWEETLANRLDALNIEWIRPQPLIWIDKKENQRKYFPDFYLPKYDLYIDPKNTYACVSQKEKVEWLKTNIKNLIFLTNLDDIKNFTPIAQLDRAKTF